MEGAIPGTDFMKRIAGEMNITTTTIKFPQGDPHIISPL